MFPLVQLTTRTTRMPAFLEQPCCPMITHTIHSYWIPSQNKTSQSYKFQEFANTSNFLILMKTLHATHLLMKLFDKMCKYEMDPASIVEDTEQTRFCPQMDRWMDGQTNRRKRWNQYTPFQLHWSVGYSKTALICIMAWGQIGDKPLSEPMLTQFTDAYMQH